MPMHRNVRVRANGWDASVDEQLVPLIRELRRAGIYTISSCQGGPPSIPLNPEGKAYTEAVQQDPSLADRLPPDPHVTFPGSEAEALLNLIRDGKALRGGVDEHPGMWDRISTTPTPTPRIRKPGATRRGRGRSLASTCWLSRSASRPATCRS